MATSTFRFGAKKIPADCNAEAFNRPGNMGAVGFEPTKANANGFTARPLWPLGYTPYRSTAGTPTADRSPEIMPYRGGFVKCHKP